MLLHAATSAKSNRSSRAQRLVAAIIDGVDSRIGLEGQTAAAAKPMISGYSMAGFVFAGTRNPDCWANDVSDITAISVGNTYAGDWRGCTLIAPDVVLMVNHVNIANGANILFLTNDGNNTLVSREQTASQRIGTTDIMLGKLASDVPGTISFAKVLSPSDWAGFKTIALISAVPALRVNKARDALIGDLSSFTYLTVNTLFTSCADATRQTFYAHLANGDSGNAAAYIMGDDLVLECAWHYGAGFGGAGETIHHNRDEINAAMTALGSAYQLTELSF